MTNIKIIINLRRNGRLNGSNLTINGVNKKIGGKEILKNVSFVIKQGEFFSILGPSGCGKTTLLRMIAGFDFPDSGVILSDDRNLIELAPNKRKVNTIFQTYALFPHLTIFENVAFPLRLKKMSEKEIKTKVVKYLQLVKLEEHAKKYPAQLSGGQKQRVSIARALINEPRVLLLDEPLSALDAKLRQHMLVELDKIHDEVGITFIFVTHDQQEALSVSDRIAVMKDGEVLQVGTPSEIYEAPVNAFVADFIGETNFLEGKVIRTFDKYAEVDVDGLGIIKIEMDKVVKEGDFVKSTIRPEKIKITTEKPETSNTHMNIVKGHVDELIYSGFQTKFFVKTESNIIFKVFKQHIQYFMNDSAINWKDEVYIAWDADDGYIVEVVE